MKSDARRIRHPKGAWLWLALGCAFAPVLLHLGRSTPDRAFGWSVALAPALTLLAARAERRPPAPQRGWALLLFGSGVLAELIGLVGGSWTLATLGLPVSAVGVALWIGAPRARVAALLLWVVPIPVTLFGLTTPGLESLFARLGAGAVALLGASIDVSGPLMRSGDHHLELDPYHSGLHLAFVNAELAWYGALRRRLALNAAATRALAAALAALPLQVLAVFVAVLLLASGAPELASDWLDHGVWALAVIVGLGWIELRAAPPAGPGYSVK